MKQDVLAQSSAIPSNSTGDFAENVKVALDRRTAVQ
jgi:hypothetical protein